MHRILIPALVAAMLAGCGLAETAATTAAVGASEVEQAKDAKATEQRIEQRITDIQQQQADRRNAADNATN